MKIQKYLKLKIIVGYLIFAQKCLEIFNVPLYSSLMKIYFNTSVLFVKCFSPPARQPPSPFKCHDNLKSASSLDGSAIFWVNSPLGAYPMLMPGVKYHHALPRKTGVFFSVRLVTSRHLPQANVIKLAASFLPPARHRCVLSVHVALISSISWLVVGQS